MHIFFDRLARGFAWLGGLTLLLLVGVTCASIVGRSLNSVLHGEMAQALLPDVAATLLSLGVGPITGDFEIVEAGMAFAVFAFLPLCHLRGAHASVDIFTSSLSPRSDRWLRAATDTIFAAVLVLIAWQLLAGLHAKRASGQTTFLLALPVWWAYAACFVPALAAALVSVHVATIRLVEAVTGQRILPSDAAGDR